MLLQQSKDVKHYNNCYLADPTKCINFNKIVSALLNTIGIVQCCLWLGRVIASHQLLKSRILHSLNMWHKIDLKVTKTSQRQLPLYTGSFYRPAFSSIVQTCHGGKEYTKMFQRWSYCRTLLAHGPRVQAVHLITPKQTLYLGEDLHYWKLDEPFCSPWKAELRFLKKCQFKNFIRK